MRIRLEKSFKPLIAETLEKYAVKDFTEGTTHPLAIWNSSYTKVIDKFQKVLTDLEALLNIQSNLDKKGEVISTLMDNYESLLFAVHTLIKDDTTRILEILGGNFYKQHKAVKAFRSFTKEIDSRIGNVVNKIKHEQRSLVPVNHIFNNTLTIPGYMVAVNESNRIQPCKITHKEKGDNVISMLFELRYILIWLYLFGKSLSICVIALKKPSKAEIKSLNPEPEFSLIQRLCLMPKLYPSNEGKKKIPNIKFDEKKHCCEMSFEGKPSKSCCDIIPLGTKIGQEIIFSSDGVTANFELPIIE